MGGWLRLPLKATCLTITSRPSCRRGTSLRAGDSRLPVPQRTYGEARHLRPLAGWSHEVSQVRRLPPSRIHSRFRRRSCFVIAKSFGDYVMRGGRQIHHYRRYPLWPSRRWGSPARAGEMRPPNPHGESRRSRHPRPLGIPPTEPLQRNSSINARNYFEPRLLRETGGLRRMFLRPSRPPG